MRDVWPRRAMKRLADFVRVHPGRSAVGLITLASFAIRLNGVNAWSLWDDELAEAVVAQLPWNAFFEGVRSHAAGTPLDYLGVKATTFLLGTTTTATRLWAAACGAAAVAAMAWAAWEVYRSRLIAGVSATLLAVAPFHVSYSQEARFYAMASLVTLVAIGSFARAMRTSRTGDWVLLGFAYAAAVYTHYFAASLAIASVIAVVLVAGLRLAAHRFKPPHVVYWRRRISGLVVAGVVALALFSPWLVYAFIEQMQIIYVGFPQPDPFTADFVAGVLQSLLAPMGGEAVVLQQAAVVGLTIILAGVGLRDSKPWKRPAGMLLLLAIVITLPLIWAADLRSGFFFHPRQAIGLLVVLLLLAGAGLVGTGDRLARYVRVGGTGRAMAIALLLTAWLGLVSPLVGRQLHAPWRTHQDWRGAAAFIVERACPESTIYVNLPATYDYGVGYYRSELLPGTREISGRPLYAQIQSLGLEPSDWIVVRRNHPEVDGEQGLAQIDAITAGHEMQAHDFPALRVYAPSVQC